MAVLLPREGGVKGRPLKKSPFFDAKVPTAIKLQGGGKALMVSAIKKKLFCGFPIGSVPIQNCWMDV